MQQRQIEFPYEDVYDALRAAVHAAGGAKHIGHLLWPTKPVPEAHRDLLDALNRDRARKLDPEEVLRVLRLAREAGFHAAFHYACEHAGYKHAQPQDPVEEANDLQSRAERLLVELKQVTERQERLARSPMSVIDGSKKSAA